MPVQKRSKQFSRQSCRDPSAQTQPTECTSDQLNASDTTHTPTHPQFHFIRTLNVEGMEPINGGTDAVPQIGFVCPCSQEVHFRILRQFSAKRYKTRYVSSAPEETGLW